MSGEFNDKEETLENDYESAWEEANATKDTKDDALMVPSAAAAAAAADIREDEKDKEAKAENADTVREFELTSVSPESSLEPSSEPFSETAPSVAPLVAPSVTPPLSFEPQQPGESDEKYEQRYKTLQGIHRHDKEAWELEKQGYLAELEKFKKSASNTAPANARKLTVEEAYDNPPASSLTLTDEEKEELERYEQDFDVVSAMEGKKRRMELDKLRKEFQETLKSSLSEIVSQLTPVMDSVYKSEQEKHLANIRNAHEDFETYRDDGSIVSWIESKPKYIQTALKETYDNGATQDIIDLITDFKRENDININSNSSLQPIQPIQPDSASSNALSGISNDASNIVDMNARKAEKKQNLTAVNTRKGAVNPGYTSPNDYEGAWDEAIRKQGG